MSQKGVRDTLSRALGLVIPLAISLLLAASSQVHKRINVIGHKHEVELSWSLIFLAGTLGLVEAGLVVKRQRKLAAFHLVANRADAAEFAVLRQIREELMSLESLAHFFSSDRISLFRMDSDGFVLIGRRSRNPGFNHSRGRGRYPADEGVIARAWKLGAAEEKGLPSAGRKSEPSKAWQQAQAKRWGVPEGVSARFEMRSEWYLAVRIEERDGALGVLLFESEVTPDEAKSAGATTADRVKLEGFAKAAGTRLAALIVASRSIDLERIQEQISREKSG